MKIIERTTDSNIPETMTIKEVQDVLHCSRGTVEKYMYSGELAYFKLGRLVLISKESVSLLFRRFYNDSILKPEARPSKLGEA